MGNNSDVFRAESSTVWHVFNDHNGGVGFRIPVYQRQYDWKEKDIERLFESIVNGFIRLEKQPQSLTFLGTLILVVERKKEQTFSGTSLAIVDGQQRLISLSLIIGQLQAKIYPLLNALKSDTLKKEACEWLVDKVDCLLNQLFTSSLGEIHSRSQKKEYYPRLIRDDDHRATNYRDSEYRSNISEYLLGIKDSIIKEQYNFDFRDEESSDSETFNTCMDNINEMLSGIEQGKLLEFELPSIETLLTISNYKHFFGNIDDHSKHEKISSVICKRKSEKIDRLVRLLLFGNYLLEMVNLVKVEVSHKSEEYAYDIFESLNTTGEPLTAIQTLKPRVIQHLDENKKRKYRGSDEEEYFKEIESYLSLYRKKDNQQRESAEIVIFLRYYLYGEKVSRSLSIQRTFIRDTYDKLEMAGKKKYIKAIQDITKYRKKFWDKTKIVESCASFQDSDLLGFCLLFISAMKTTMSIPILVRYWIYSEEKRKPEIFVEAVKSLTAFLVLRRSITSGTSGIDTEFRDILKNGSLGENINNQPISVFDEKGKGNDCPDVQTLKNCFKYSLSRKEILLGEIEKNSWVNKATEQDAYKSTALCKFFLLVAAHYTAPDDEDPCILITRFSHQSSNHMTASYWMHPDYDTIEHIAPQSLVEGWDSEIYKTPNLNGSIGNLTLLPNFDNSTVGNKPWNTKKLYYKAFLAENEEELNKSIKNAEKEGCAFGEKLEKNLRERKETRLILSSIADAKEWNKETIQKRGRNIAELVWDKIAPWLDIK